MNSQIEYAMSEAVKIDKSNLKYCLFEKLREREQLK